MCEYDPHIVEYEQKGADRAKYGEKLLKCLSERLGKKKYSVTTLKVYRQFYQVYSHLDKEVAGFLLSQTQIGQSMTDQFGDVDVFDKKAPLTVKSNLLFNKLSFTHLVAILPISDPLERTFYETMAIRGTWSVRELQRQIDSNYYVRSGWSQKPEALAKLVDGKAEKDSLALDIKSPFTFEFLGLQAKDVVEESEIPA